MGGVAKAVGGAVSSVVNDVKDIASDIVHKPVQGIGRAVSTIGTPALTTGKMVLSAAPEIRNLPVAGTVAKGVDASEQIFRNDLPRFKLPTRETTADYLKGAALVGAGGYGIAASGYGAGAAYSGLAEKVTSGDARSVANSYLTSFANDNFGGDAAFLVSDFLSGNKPTRTTPQGTLDTTDFSNADYAQTYGTPGPRSPNNNAFYIGAAILTVAAYYLLRRK